MKNIESITKFCSTLNDIFGYPFFFNWSFPTNHRDNNIEGVIGDAHYVIFRAGISQEMSFPIEKQLWFAQVSKITSFCIFPKKYNITNFEEIIAQKEELKDWLLSYLTTNSEKQLLDSLLYTHQKWSDDTIGDTIIP
jgi:hypothetical protein